MNKNLSLPPHLAGFLLALLVPCRTVSASPTTLDVSRAFSYTDSAGQAVSLPAVTPASDPPQITAKFTGLIRYFNDRGINGTIYSPQGVWRLTQTLYLNHANSARPGADLNTSLLGAGQNETVLEGAPGYQEMPLVMLGRRVQDVGTDLNALHHPRVNDLYDNSVTGVKYGLRTISTPEGVTLHDRGAWKPATAYVPGDEVTLDDPKSQYVCTVAHTSSEAVPLIDRPVSGFNWRGFWRQIGVPASGYFQDSPLSAGPLDPAKDHAQATYWRNTDQLTIDALVKNNSAANMNGVICAVGNSDYAGSAASSIWILSVPKDGGPVFSIVLPTDDMSASGASLITAHIGSALPQGVHRITVQASLRDPDRTLAAWIDGVQQKITVDGKTGSSYGYPAGTHFVPYQAGGLILGTDERGRVGMADQDWTIGGLKLSNGVRYAVQNAGDPQTTIAGAPPTDLMRYFSNDPQTIAYLPLDDAPPADSDAHNPLWTTVKVQHGMAATRPGAAPQSGYGWWVQGPGEYQAGTNIGDLTLRCPDARYGVPFSIYLNYGVAMRNVTLDGGYSCFSHWPCGSNNYVMSLRNVVMKNASNAGINNIGQGMYVADYLSISNCGRQAMYLPLSAGDWKHLTLEPAPFSDYLVSMPSDQAQAQMFFDLTVLPEPSHRWPARGVMTIGRQLYGITGPNQFVIDGVHAMNLPPGIVFVDLPDYIHGWTWPMGTVRLEDYHFSVAGGGKLSAFLRADSPGWRGVIPGATQELTGYLDRWLDPAGGALPWHSNGGYSIDDIVAHKGKLFRCIRAHTNWPREAGTLARHEPEVGQDWPNFWKQYTTTNLLFVHPDFAGLPATGRWVEGAHVLRVNKPGGGYAEYRCVKSGDAGSTDPRLRPQWRSVVPTTAQ